MRKLEKISFISGLALIAGVVIFYFFTGIDHSHPHKSYVTGEVVNHSNNWIGQRNFPFFSVKLENGKVVDVKTEVSIRESFRGGS